jgi:TonB family protein
MRALAAVVLLVSTTAGAQEVAPPEVLEQIAAEPPEGAGPGTVGLEVLVDEDGRSAEVTVVSSDNPALDEAAVAAVRQYRWRPATVEGKPVKVRLRYDLRFEPEPPPEPGPAPPAATRPRGGSALTGLVRERGTRRPLPFAEVQVVTAAGELVEETTTDAGGRFRVAELPAGGYRVTVVSPGHRRRVFEETVGEGQVLDVTYGVDPTGTSPYRTVVEGEGREEVERRTATQGEATRIAGTRGDALRVVETFPGVARPPLGVGALIVRGSNPEDTIPYIAGHPIPLVYHFGGLTSIINSDLLARIDFLPGNFSSRFGNATGGVVEVELRAPRRDRLGGSIDANLIDTGVLLEGPIGDGSFAIAARRSYIDALLPLLLPDDAGLSLTTAPRYWDYQAIYDRPLLGGRLTFTAFGSSDALELVLDNPANADPSVRGTLGSRTYVQRLVATFRKDLGGTQLLATAAQGTTSLFAGLGEALRIEIVQHLFSGRVEVAHELHPRVRLTAGADSVFYPFRATARGPRVPGEGEVPTPISVQEELEQDVSDWELKQGVYAEARVDLGRGLTFTGGGRLAYYRVVDDGSVDLRGSLRWQTGAHAFTAALGRYSNTPQEFESDVVFGNPAIDPYHALHGALGWDFRPAAWLSVEATLFGKLLDDVVVRSDELVMRDGREVVEGYSNDGDGRAGGVELLVKLSGKGPVSGWVSYTLSRAERRDGPGEERRPFTFDQTHILSLVATAELPWRLVAGARFRYVTGNPETPITGSYYDADADVYVPIPGATNSGRVPSYNQLDLRLERRWVFDRWALTAYIDVQNAYNRANPEATIYSYDYREQQVLSGLPIIPSLGLKGEL